MITRPSSLKFLSVIARPLATAPPWETTTNVTLCCPSTASPTPFGESRLERASPGQEAVGSP
jgi:hypothetical protein